MQFDSAFQALIELAASRHNAFSTSEAADINFSSRRLRDAAARGDIRRLHPRVWAINALPNSELQRLRAATLSLSGSAASLLSALGYTAGSSDLPTGLRSGPVRSRQPDSRAPMFTVSFASTRASM